MDANFPIIAKGTQLREGGYSAARDDGGNWTGGKACDGRFVGSCFGISATAMAHWLGPGRPVTVKIMKSVTPDVFLAIARAFYWRPLNGPLLPSGLDLITFDFGFNAGVARAAKMLQGLLGVAQDGDIGPLTLAAVAAREKAGALPALIDAFANGQRAYYRALSGFPTYGDGWLARVDWRLHAGLALARGETKIPLA
ncbi:hypothetical protein AA12717_0379 [Gluconacetobacter sacchari DSM 12717]|uniref:Secretion activator protein n=2 Tax=Gluconacetobacter sacchari TaxID=92759 RepID=A0A7W4IC20_9PROT|nr:glycosyl hydrolase 108 family protein [Gluconacetobacter sacchari]MBB2160104.1 secretion activator protein [Gluconacetobacter sacchari]GBQ19872.1 hypothetical protein AA12717_0379 [Gluconacetobacter sacchari DSM 12717]